MLNQRVAVYVPVDAHQNKPSVYEEDVVSALGYTKRAFARTFGGYTAVEADGGWVDEEGELVQERILIVYAFTDLHTADTVVKDIAEQVKQWLAQDCVSVELGGGLTFV